MIVQVKYCGGCNPRYEREALLERLTKAFPQIDFQTQLCMAPAAAVVICGCDAACAEVSGCIGSSGRIVIWKESAYEAVYRFLQEILQKQKIESEDK